MQKVTVVIPNYNGIKYIAACLDSLYRLKEQDLFCVLVVDNGSADSSPDVIRTRYPQVKLIPLSENTGFCHAVNVGIEKARTPYVILLNNDTVVLPGFVESFERAKMTGEMYLTGQGGYLFTKLFLNDMFEGQSGFISSDMLTDEQVDEYFRYAAELGITLDTKIKKTWEIVE